MNQSTENNILEQYENMRKSDKKGSGLKWIILLVIISILSIGGFFLMPTLKNIISGSDDPIPPFEIVIPKTQDIIESTFTIQIKDSKGEIKDYNKNIHRGIEFNEIKIDGEDIELIGGNQIIPCLSLYPDDVELYIEWDVTDRDNWGEETDSDFPYLELYFNSKKTSPKADCSFKPLIDYVSFTSCDSCCEAIVNFQYPEKYEQFKDQINISIDGGKSYQKNNVFKFTKNIDFAKPKSIQVIAYFEGYEKNTKDILDWEDLDCTHLYFVDPLQEEFDNLVNMANNLEGWMEDGWNSILNEEGNLKKAIDKLEKQVNIAIEKRGNEAAREDLIKEAMDAGVFENISDADGLSPEEINQKIIDFQNRINAINKAEEEGFEYNNDMTTEEILKEVDNLSASKIEKENKNLRIKRESQLVKLFENLFYDPFSNSGDKLINLSYIRNSQIYHLDEQSMGINELINFYFTLQDEMSFGISIEWLSNNASQNGYVIPSKIYITE